MINVFHTLIARFLQIPEGQVERTIGLLNEGATIPFISRYRKEVTGGLDEVQIGAIKDQLDKLTELSKRKETILCHDRRARETYSPSSGNASRSLGIAPRSRIYISLTDRNGSPRRKSHAGKDWNPWLRS